MTNQGGNTTPPFLTPIQFAALGSVWKQLGHLLGELQFAYANVSADADDEECDFSDAIDGCGDRLRALLDTVWEELSDAEGMPNSNQSISVLRVIRNSLSAFENLVLPSFDQQVSASELALTTKAIYDSREVLRGLLESDTDQGSQPPGHAETNAADGYSPPNHYARDKWIYENIDKHSCSELSVKLKEAAKPHHWQLISSRNAFKNAAEKYATFAGLTKKGFPDKRKVKK